MTIATAKLAIVAALVASVSYAVAAFKHRREIGEGGTAAAALRPVARPWRLLVAIAALLLVHQSQQAAAGQGHYYAFVLLALLL